MRKNSRVIKMREEQDDNNHRPVLSRPVAQASGSAMISRLMLIQKTVQHFASLLANVLQLEVEVVDNLLLRVAGTGVYGQQLGETPQSNTLLLSEVIEKKQEVVIFDSRKNPLCQACQQRESCKERGFVGVPVIYQQRCIGVISLIAINNEQLWHLREHTSMFIEYIRHISTLLVANIAALQRSEISVDPLLAFLAQSLEQGVMVFDKRQRVTFINDSARRRLNIVDDPVLQPVSLLLPTKTEPGEQTLTLHLDGDRWLLHGRCHDSGNGVILLFSRCWQEPDKRPEPDAPVIKNLIGQSPAMRQLKALIGRIAASPSSVMILGESGTGKEVVAQAIHRLSSRHAQPFIAINCAAIPENLLESELFGYVKGAFTGAAPGGKKGLIQLAHGGTLFLDEIGDMPLTLQARLLRAIESREVMPIGAGQAVPVDIRIVSATHQHLPDKIREGLFREDLYYRLNVVPVSLPPLRQREGDIPLLLQHFLTLHAGKIGRHVAGVSLEVLRLLGMHRWPGNVRELSNLVEYLVNLVPEGELIDSALLPPNYHFPRQQQDTTLLHATPASSPAMQITAPPDAEAASNLRSVEKTLIEEALLRSRSKKQAADELGIGLATLYRKIKRYGLK